MSALTAHGISFGVIDMKKIGEFWVPDADAAPGSNLERTRAAFDGGEGIQIAHLDAALAHLGCFELAIDGGANVGSWTKRMAGRFAEVHSFEPNKGAYECLARNVADWGLANVTLHPNAISDRSEFVKVEPQNHTARTVTARIVGGGDIEAVTIDSLNVSRCSFLKLDVEGYEHRALKGAEHTLTAFKPWVLIENKPEQNKAYGDPNGAVSLLEELGYSLAEKIGAKQIDWLFRPA